jgi:predicted metal-dependent phosphoesterase TrpH
VRVIVTAGQEARREMNKAEIVCLVLSVCTALFGAGCNESAAPLLKGEWYKGDLHCHSTHSDGDSSVREVIASAESKGLDFFVITDHDGSMDGSPTQWYDPDYRSDRMVMLYGVEWTTGLGHANVWASGPFDYDDLWLANRARDAQRAIDAAHARNALFSINHPSAFLCCPWEYEAYEGLDSIEVWNSMYLLPNFNFLSTKVFWDDHLLSGKRIPGVGGSDTHQLVGFEANFLRHAEPTTWVYAEERSAEAILQGIRAGHVSLSDEPRAPRVDLMADTDDDGVFETLMGDNVVLSEEANVTLKIQIVSREAVDTAGTTRDLTSEMVSFGEAKAAHAEEKLVSAFLKDGEYLVVLLRNGDLHGLWKASGDTGRIELTERIAPGEQVFYRIELLGRPPPDFINALLRGVTKALSNPIYFNYQD